MINQLYKTIRVLIADDHALLREGFRTMLRRNSEIEFVGEAENGKEVVKLAEQQKPDIIFIDISMPVLNGIEATRLLSKKFPDISVIALTIYDEEHLIVDMMEAGARGYLVKNAAKEEILEAIHTVYEGGHYYCRHTSAKLATMIGNSKFNPYKKIRVTEFSKREREVVELVCREFSNKEIALKMGLSVRTIEAYRERIHEKMEVKNTAGLVVYAIKKGLYKPGV